MHRSLVSSQSAVAEQPAEHLMGRGREGEITQLREYRDGDELRQVHWKQTARQQRLIAVDRPGIGISTRLAADFLRICFGCDFNFRLLDFLLDDFSST